MAIEDADKSGVYVLCVTTTPKAWKKTLAMCSGRARIRTALGLHPELAHERISELPLFEHLAGDTKYFGEIGLDGSPQWANAQSAQLRVFQSILRMASENGGRILSIHSRRAVDEVLSCLAKEPSSGTPILHWFSGSQAQLKRAIDQDCWFSCGPAMLRSEGGKAIAARVPRDRVLTETDGPFALDGSRPLQPKDSWRAVSMLAEIWKMPEIEVQQILRQNLRALVHPVR